MSAKEKLTMMIVFFMIIAYPGIRSIHAALTFERTDISAHEETRELRETAAGTVVMPLDKTRASGPTGRATATVDLLAGNAAETEQPGPRYILSEDEKKMISIVAWNADHSSDESLMCVIMVIKNRLESDKFTKTETDELNKSEAEAKKNREAITKNTQTLIDQYPELLQ